MKADSVTNALNDNLQLTHDLGIEGTPALIMNGEHIIQGAISYDNLEQVIDKLNKSYHSQTKGDPQIAFKIHFLGNKAFKASTISSIILSV